MNRLLVTLLAALDAAIAVAVGLAVVGAPLTLLWVFGFPGVEDWAALWPAAARLWQFGHFVPIEVTLTEEYLTATGIPDEAASFVLSLAPTALAAFTAIFAARSGARAAKASAWPFGVAAGTVVVAAAATGVALTSRIDVAAAEMTLAIVLPVVVYAVPCLAGALVGAWRHGDDGWVDAVRAAAQRHPRWALVPAAAARGLAAAVVGIVGLGALGLTVAVLARAGAIVGLYQSAHLDLVGVIVLSLGQLAYLPTFVVWGAAYVAGPGFALGAGTTVSPAGTSLGIVPGIPVLGAIPDASSTWMLLLALAVVGVGALAGWIARTRLAADGPHDEPVLTRLVVLGVLVAGSAAAAALGALLASGAMGPGRLATVGPDPGGLALAVAVEAGIGAGILLLAPRLEPEPAAAAPDGASARRQGGQPWRDHGEHLDARSDEHLDARSDETPDHADAADTAEPWAAAEATQPIEPLSPQAAAEPPDAAETIPLDEHLPPRTDAEDEPRPPLD